MTIFFIEEKLLKKGLSKKYPYIVEDEGLGTLEKFIKAHDEGRRTEMQISETEYIDFDFDYTEFDLEALNQKLHNEIRKIKHGFEND